jgi:IstB-like ATP binding protein
MTSTANSIDTAHVELLLSELRLPGVKAIWPKLAALSDKEGWPAARFLAALAEQEIADRTRRRIERHMAEARLPTGKTLATFDFDNVPMVSKAQVMALTSGDVWLKTGANLLLFGPPGGGKSHLSAAIGLATRRERLARPVRAYHRSRAAIADGAARIGVGKCHRQTRPLRPPDPRRHRLCQKGSGGDQRAVRADRRALRATLVADHGQPALRRMGPHLPRSCYDAGSHRPPRAPRHNPRDERRELPPQGRPRPQTRTRSSADACDGKGGRETAR